MKKIILLLLVIVAIACNEEEQRIESTPELGKAYQGGIVFYIFKESDALYVKGEIHGLIAAEKDLVDGIWGCSSTPVNQMVDYIGFGDVNTDLITSTCPGNNAALICGSLVLNGYKDWYLPNFEEIQELCFYNTIVGGFNSGYYWTSSKYSYSEAIIVNVIMYTYTKSGLNNIHHIRPIRKF